MKESTWSRLPLQEKRVQNTSYLLSSCCCVARWAATACSSFPPPGSSGPRPAIGGWSARRRYGGTIHYPPSLQPDPILPFLQEYPHTCCMLELEYCLHRRRRITDETKKEVNRMQNVRGALVNMIYSIPR